MVADTTDLSARQAGFKILHVEDNPLDAELVRGLLHEAWPESRLELVTNRAEFDEALSRCTWDLILCDYAMGQFDGLEALRSARAHCPEIPFVFLSGEMGEDRALEAVRTGASDYVLKNSIKRLVPAIQRVLRDNADRQRAKHVESERQRLAAILENTPDFVGLAAPDERVVYLNQAARRMLGLPAEGLPDDLRIGSVHPAEVRHRFIEEALPAAARHGTWAGENLLIARDGTHIPVSQVLIAHRTVDGKVEYFSTVMRDLTARKRTEAIVYGQKQVLEMIAGGEPVNDTLSAVVQLVESQSDEMMCSVLVADDDSKHLHSAASGRLPPAYLLALGEVTIGPNIGSCGTAAYRRTSIVVEDIATDPLWANYRDLALQHGLRACWSTPMFDANHRLLGTFVVYLSHTGSPTPEHLRLIDIGTHLAVICLNRHRAERQLKDQADILNKATDAIVVTDLANRVTFWNPGAERVFGWSAAEALGRQEQQLFPTETITEMEAARRAMDQREEWRGEMAIQDRHGATHIMEARITMIRDEVGRPQGRLSIATDVTAKKRIEEQFFRAQRMESIGMLAAGIAHDLNNVLAPILLAAPMLKDHVTDPTDLRMLSTLEKSAERGAALVRQILGFAHGAGGEYRSVQAKHLLRDVASFIEETFPKKITFEHHIPTDLWTVKANPTQLHQVVLNLCVNARDAMPDGGTLTLRGENLLLDAAGAAAIAGASPGAYLVVHVQDTGTGIPPDVVARMWEPFYTTKTSGKGTGLGLSTVRGIVQSHGGFTTVQTELGLGTTFRVHLPAAENPAPKTAAEANAPQIPRGANELILVVDDEASIRSMAAAILTHHGYRVLSAADGAEAVALFAPHSKDIRVVITDLSMPNLDGAALAGVVRRISPEVKIVAVSGHDSEESGGQREGSFADAFIGKPFRAEVLLGTIHSLLNSKTPVVAQA